MTLVCEGTLRKYFKGYEEGNAEAIPIREYQISTEQLMLREEVVEWFNDCGMNDSHSGIIQLLHTKRCEYRLVKVQPNGGNEAEQKDFTEQNETLKEKSNTEIFFVDAVHPSYTIVSYGWGSN